MPDPDEKPGFTLVDDPTPHDAESKPLEAHPIDFSTFVLSLSTSALLHLGVATRDGPTQAGDAAEINLPMARQTIDILEMIQKKTQGNLAESERALLEHALHDLRMRFVEARRKQS